MDVVRRNKGAFIVAIVANTGSMLFGFDTGVAGAVTSMMSFRKDFHLAASPSKAAASSSNIVALLNAGAFFGAMAPSLVGRHIGRRHMLALAGFLFMIGGILQTAAQPPSLSMLYGGRVIAGFGVGIISNTTPVFVAECSPKHLRGLMMAFFEMFLVSGGMLAYWTTYGCSLHVSPTKSSQWRIPLSIQIILAGIVTISCWFAPESPRWLARGDRWDDARRSLARLRNLPESDEAITVEMAEIATQIDEEIASTNGRSFKEMFMGKNFTRLCWGLGVACLAMWTGHNSILYYGPTVFREIGFTAQDAALFASGMITVIKFGVTGIFVLTGIGIFKRKHLFAVGAFFMGVFMFALGAILATNPPYKGSEHSPAGRGMMAMIYLFIVAYSMSWGPVSWVYMGEIFPTRLRDWGMGLCGLMTWGMNYCVSKLTPIMVLNIGWKTWMIFGTMNIVAVIFSIFMPETKGVKLEDMDVLFGVVDEESRRQDIENHIAAVEKRVDGADEIGAEEVGAVAATPKAM
ncbi:hypothetical protein A1O1_02153 [Capronia coronata CBS 617.96]|uniref:Major facilitator superfamily (MFS) profile domain-containing protein n=1 Tax=Capronia coronata CBS 617.96 TaxID=1182541 RepID=W9YVP2_9EURO|nr:uncharacterized protein A1O1_02153 [Capronia coronata CBS 617.96]EXJ93760.1 hypothetical protein A1O1_02153 [Capronia coronata CBS 617.96]